MTEEDYAELGRSLVALVDAWRISRIEDSAAKIDRLERDLFDGLEDVATVDDWPDNR